MRATAGWNETREIVDVRLWNPSFPRLPQQVRQQVAFLFLDNLLGEDDVERWIGTIETSDQEIGGRTPQELREEVRRRAAAASRDVWILAERTDERGNKALVSANAALKRIDHPFAVHHLSVTVERGLEQLAGTPWEMKDLDTAEDDLIHALDGVASPAGRVTERRQRKIHFVVDDPTRARDLAQQWAVQHRRFGPRVEVKSDPTWAFRTELFG
jgi:hypothetical protein